jgi:hypothetical protein
MRVLCVYILAAPDRFVRAAHVFADSYREYPAGAEHDLLLVDKRRDWRADWTGPAPAHVLPWPEGDFDIGPFQFACRLFAREYDRVMLMSGTARILTDDWLGKYLRAFTGDVAAVASTGSLETGISGRAPNPHLRTANIMVDPAELNALGLPRASSKHECWEVEHGGHSLTLALLARGRRCLVIDRAGGVHERDGWRDSGTYCSGGQANLIIADQWTDHWAHGDPVERARMTALAWPA